MVDSVWALTLRIFVVAAMVQGIHQHYHHNTLESIYSLIWVVIVSMMISRHNDRLRTIAHNNYRREMNNALLNEVEPNAESC